MELIGISLAILFLMTAKCTSLDLCDSSPCEHGGQCLSYMDAYQCKCQFGYTGENCQHEAFGAVKSREKRCPNRKRMNACRSLPCQNGGECRLAFTGYYCLCQSGYAGDNCEIPVKVCEYLSVTGTEGHQHIEGSYKHIENACYRARNVYQHTSGNYYLYYHNDQVWAIAGEKCSLTAFLRNPQTVTYPEMASRSWQEARGESWDANAGIEVKCTNYWEANGVAGLHHGSGLLGILLTTLFVILVYG